MNKAEQLENEVEVNHGPVEIDLDKIAPSSVGNDVRQELNYLDSYREYLLEQRRNSLNFDDY